MNIYLTGFMGSGKSVVGAALARLLRRPFVDLDRQIEREVGLTVAAIFEGGEAVFRRKEGQVLRRVSIRRGCVVALGGGTLLDAENRKRVALSGVLVRLTCGEAELWRRLKPDLAVRPLLDGPAPRRALSRLLRARRGAYKDAAFSLSTTRRSPKKAADMIAAWLSKR